jgi:hypothetical protein
MGRLQYSFEFHEAIPDCHNREMILQDVRLP